MFAFYINLKSKEEEKREKKKKNLHFPEIRIKFSLNEVLLYMYLIELTNFLHFLSSEIKPAVVSLVFVLGKEKIISFSHKPQKKYLEIC